MMVMAEDDMLPQTHFQVMVDDFQSAMRCIELDGFVQFRFIRYRRAVYFADDFPAHKPHLLSWRAWKHVDDHDALRLWGHSIIPAALFLRVVQANAQTEQYTGGQRDDRHRLPQETE